MKRSDQELPHVNATINSKPLEGPKKQISSHQQIIGSSLGASQIQITGQLPSNNTDLVPSNKVQISSHDQVINGQSDQSDEYRNSMSAVMPSIQITSEQEWPPTPNLLGSALYPIQKTSAPVTFICKMSSYEAPPSVAAVEMKPSDQELLHVNATIDSKPLDGLKNQISSDQQIIDSSLGASQIQVPGQLRSNKTCLVASKKVKKPKCAMYRKQKPSAQKTSPQKTSAPATFICNISSNEAPPSVASVTMKPYLPNAMYRIQKTSAQKNSSPEPPIHKERSMLNCIKNLCMNTYGGDEDGEKHIRKERSLLNCIKNLCMNTYGGDEDDEKHIRKERSLLNCIKNLCKNTYGGDEDDEK